MRKCFVRKGNPYIAFFVLTLSLILSASIAYGMPAALTDDTYTDSSKANQTHWNKKSVEVMDSPVTRTVYIKFSLSALPAGVIGDDVDQAVLSLFVNDVQTPGIVEVRRILDPTGASTFWTEGNLTYQSAPGSAPSGDGELITTLFIESWHKGLFVQADVTDLVKAWLNGATNNGIALVAQTADMWVRFDSKENRKTYARLLSYWE